VRGRGLAATSESVQGTAEVSAPEKAELTRQQVPGRVRQSALESDEAVVIGPPPVPGDAAGLTFPYDQQKDVPAAEKVGTCSLHTFALRLNLTVRCESKKTRHQTLAHNFTKY